MEKDKIHKIEFENGIQMQMTEEASVYIAAHVASQIQTGVFRSLDDHEQVLQKEGSYLNNEFDERRFRDEYGLNNKSRLLEEPALSDHEHFKKDVKRQNLISMFL